MGVKRYKTKYHQPTHQTDGYWVVVDTLEKNGLIIVEIPHYLKHPKAVATAVAESLNSNKKLILVDMI